MHFSFNTILVYRVDLLKYVKIFNSTPTCFDLKNIILRECACTLPKSLNNLKVFKNF
jgi:hypothetical protein